MPPVSVKQQACQTFEIRILVAQEPHKCFQGLLVMAELSRLAVHMWLDRFRKITSQDTERTCHRIRHMQNRQIECVHQHVTKSKVHSTHELLNFSCAGRIQVLVKLKGWLVLYHLAYIKCRKPDRLSLESASLSTQGSEEADQWP